MARVSCALRAFEVAPEALQSCRSRDVAMEFLSRLDPAIDTCGVEVYRLHKLHAEDQLHEGDELLCSVPAWNFDFNSLENLFCEVEELRAKQAELEQNFERAVSSLMTCGDLIGSAARAESAVQRLRRLLAERDQQISLEKQTQQKLRADLLAIREQSEHLMQLVLEEAAVPSPATRQMPAASAGPRMIGMGADLSMPGNAHALRPHSGGPRPGQRRIQHAHGL
mmetsp:Transcript_135811/g.321874  ORF Transcript_135811/g.321874 Transcript_135811/m.321874 type:complete len:224 (+) Transcript_135811:26-697(+)